MNRDNIRFIIRAILILLIQVLVFKRVGLSDSWWWQHGHLFLYPVIILLLPFRMSRHNVILLGFALGLLIDWFYDTIGVTRMRNSLRYILCGCMHVAAPSQASGIIRTATIDATMFVQYSFLHCNQ